MVKYFVALFLAFCFLVAEIKMVVLVHNVTKATKVVRKSFEQVSNNAPRIAQNNIE